MTDNGYKPLIAVAQVKIGPETVQAVEGRDLHTALGIRKDFTNWAKQQIQRLRLVPDRDYLLALQGEQTPSGTKQVSRYWFALHAAKHIAMMANTERGFEVREYFIECERRAHGGAAPAARVEPPALPPKPFDEWSLEEIRVYLSVANNYRHVLNNGSAAWFLMRQGFPKPPTRLLPGWLQAEFEMADRPQPGAVTITVPYPNGNGGAH